MEIQPNGKQSERLEGFGDLGLRLNCGVLCIWTSRCCSGSTTFGHFGTFGDIGTFVDITAGGIWITHICYIWITYNTTVTRCAIQSG